MEPKIERLNASGTNPKVIENGHPSNKETSGRFLVIRRQRSGGWGLGGKGIHSGNIYNSQETMIRYNICIFVREMADQ